jgi:hypothetical protein
MTPCRGNTSLTMNHYKFNVNTCSKVFITYLIHDINNGKYR